MRHRARATGFISLVVAVMACSGVQKEAETAVQRADRMVTAVKDRSIKVMPDETEAMVDSLAAAKALQAAGDHRGALTSASNVASEAIRIANALGPKGTELTSAFTAMSAEVSAKVPRIKARLDQLARQSRLPASIDRARFDALRADFKTWMDDWNKAVDDFKNGELAVAFAKATAIKKKVDDANSLLGI